MFSVVVILVILVILVICQNRKLIVKIRHYNINILFIYSELWPRFRNRFWPFWPWPFWPHRVSFSNFVDSFCLFPDLVDNLFYWTSLHSSWHRWQRSWFRWHFPDFVDIFLKMLVVCNIFGKSVGCAQHFYYLCEQFRGRRYNPRTRNKTKTRQKQDKNKTKNMVQETAQETGQ